MAQSSVRYVQNCLAVVLAAGRGSRMYPLTEGCPKCLLPVANKPLICYSVEMLKRSGFQEAVIVVRESEASNVLEVLNILGCDGFEFSPLHIPDNEDWGTADSLRQLRGKLKPQHSDVLVVSCDLVSSVQVHLLMEFHACCQSTLTCLLAESATTQEEPAVRKYNSAVERDIIALTAEHQVVFFAAQADLEDSLTFSRALMRRYPHMRVSSQLTDAHLYLMQRWVLDYLAENRSISSVKGELVPHLVRHQWVHAEQSNTLPVNKRVLQTHAASSEDKDKTERLAQKLSSFAGYDGTSAGLCSPFLLCHALTVSEELCLRVNSISTFMEANRTLPASTSEYLQAVPQPGPRRPQGVSGDCSVGEGVQLGERVSIKHSAVGNHCCIGERSKITNSVLMDHVSVGEGVSLHGCVICSHAHIEHKVTLKECVVGTKFTVTREADMKGETLVLGGGLQF